MSIKLPIGEVVHHNSPRESFGDGIITEIHEQKNHSAIIKVRFSSVPGTKGFQVPDAFIITKNLSSSSELVNTWLSTYTAFHCDVCMRQKDNIQEIDGDRICNDCKKSLIRCWECGSYKRTNRIGLTTKVSFLRKNICFDCLEKYYHQCNQCGTMFSLPARQKSFPRISDEIVWCEDCIKDGAITCDCCEQNIFEEDSVQVYDHCVCGECYTKQTYICKACGQYAFGERQYPFLPGFCVDCGPITLYEQYATGLISQMTTPIRMTFRRFKEIETTPLMTRLHKKYHEGYSSAQKALSEMHSNSDDVLFKMQVERVQQFEKARPFDTLLIDLWDLTLVIVYGLPQQIGNYYDGVITATNFKQASTYKWANIHDERKKTKVVLPDGKVAYVWDKPYQFRATTEYNKDFGMEFHGPNLVIEKDKYGATAKFYIIGAIVQ